MYKVAFFDIDGTLLSFKTHEMPASARRAIFAMKAKGIVPVICTGRQASQVPPELVELFADDMITISGQYCVVAGEVVRSCPLDPEDVARVVEQVRSGLYEVLVMFHDRSFVSRLTPRIEQMSREVNIPYVEDDLALALSNPVYQMCAFISRDEEEMILSQTKHVATTRWTDLFCDLVPVEGGKDYGVRAVLEHMGLTPSEAIAFGDGENDLSMFRACGTSVAMGNAYGILKEKATYVTDDVDEDGLWNACVHFGLV